MRLTEDVVDATSLLEIHCSSKHARKKVLEKFDLRFEKSLETLRALVKKEEWGNGNTILIRYIVYTLYHVCLRYNNSDMPESTAFRIFPLRPQAAAVFNTGLVDDSNDCVYGVFELVQERKWKLVKWSDTTGARLEFDSLPNRIKYFKKAPIFDAGIPIELNEWHIIEERWRRLAKHLPGCSRAEIVKKFKDAVEDAKRRCQISQCDVIPQMFDGRLQLLLPLYLSLKGRPELALTVELCGRAKERFYYAATVIPIHCAYNNARLIAPVSGWLECAIAAPKQ